MKPGKLFPGFAFLGAPIMRKIYSAVTGVDQGTVQLFSDFEYNGPMWSGEGDRQVSVPVIFSEKFKSPPAVFVNLQMFDFGQQRNQRAEIQARDITTEGFNIHFQTWSDTKIARASAAWMAIGDAWAEDDWDIERGSGSGSSV